MLTKAEAYNLKMIDIVNNPALRPYVKSSHIILIQGYMLAVNQLAIQSGSLTERETDILLNVKVVDILMKFGPLE